MNLVEVLVASSLVLGSATGSLGIWARTVHSSHDAAALLRQQRQADEQLLAVQAQLQALAAEQRASGAPVPAIMPRPHRPGRGGRRSDRQRERGGRGGSAPPAGVRPGGLRPLWGDVMGVRVDRRSAGASLPELLVAVVVLGLLLAIGGWTGRELLARQRVEVAARELLSAIERQRDLAIRHGRPRSLAVEGRGGLLEAAAGAAGGAGGGLDLHHNLPEQLRFTANGLLIDGGTVVVAGAGTDLRRCLVMALPLGVLRLGRYAGEGGGVSAESCVRDGRA